MGASSVGRVAIPRLGVSPPLPALSAVLLAALFGFGAALLVVGVADGNLLSLALGALAIVVAVRLRSQWRREGGADAGDGETGASGSRAAADDAASPTGEERQGEEADRDAELDRAAEPDTAEGDGGFLVETAATVTEASKDGETLHGSGYWLRRVASGELVDSWELTLARDGVQIIPLEIAADQAEELQSDELAPGQPVVLVPHRSAEGRIDGIRVFDEVVDHLAGWLPDEAAKQLAGELRRGTLPARSLYEWLDATGRRRGLTVLVHRQGAVVDE